LRKNLSGATRNHLQIDVPFMVILDDRDHTAVPITAMVLKHQALTSLQQLAQQELQNDLGWRGSQVLQVVPLNRAMKRRLA
jgi:hypothetical protein